MKLNEIGDHDTYDQFPVQIPTLDAIRRWPRSLEVRKFEMSAYTIRSSLYLIDTVISQHTASLTELHLVDVAVVNQSWIFFMHVLSTATGLRRCFIERLTVLLYRPQEIVCKTWLPGDAEVFEAEGKEIVHGLLAIGARSAEDTRKTILAAENDDDD